MGSRAIKSTTLPLYYSTTLLLYYSNSLPPYHPTTLPLYDSSTLLLYCSTALLYYSTTLLLLEPLARIRFGHLRRGDSAQCFFLACIVSRHPHGSLVNYCRYHW